MADAAETFEALQARHRKEQRDLVSRTTQKKKATSKKTRKGVNEECERLEQDLKERQALELAATNGETSTLESHVAEEDLNSSDETQVNGIAKAAETLSLPSPPPGDQTQTSPQSSGAPKKPNRAKARLARQAAEREALAQQAKEEAANMPDLREQERTRMEQLFKRHGLEVLEIPADGHCLYASVADQLRTQDLGLQPRIRPSIVGGKTGLPDYKRVRYAAADFIERNSDDFVGFMEEPLGVYLKSIRESGEWGGHMELIALAKSYGVNINVLHGDGTVNKIEPGEDVGDADVNDIWLGYYKHSHGLGEHYNSLRKTP